MTNPTEALDSKIHALNKRFAKKVDSLNWQSISYQKKAFEAQDEAIKDLLLEARLDEIQNTKLEQQAKRICDCSIEHTAYIDPITKRIIPRAKRILELQALRSN